MPGRPVGPVQGWINYDEARDDIRNAVSTAQVKAIYNKYVRATVEVRKRVDVITSEIASFRAEILEYGEKFPEIRAEMDKLAKDRIGEIELG